MELRQLRTFQTAAKLLNFNRAADVLHYAQSTVSAQIKALEDELGVPLFDRLGKNIVLTEAGVNLLKYSQMILAIEEETFVEVTGRRELKGSLTVRIPQTISIYHLPEIFVKFMSRHPNVHLEFNSCTVQTLERELSTGTVDLAFLMAESILSARLETEMLGFEELVFVAHPNDALAHKDIVGFRDLEGQVLLMPNTDCDYPLRFRKILAEEKIKPASITEFNSIEAIKNCIMAGLGITLIPRTAIEQEVESGKLKIIPWSEEILETAIFMIWHKDKWMTPTLNAFLQTVRETLNK